MPSTMVSVHFIFFAPIFLIGSGVSMVLLCLEIKVMFVID